MEQYKSIEQAFDTTYKNEIKKFKTSPLKGIILLLLGVATVILYSSIEPEIGSALSPTLILAIIIFFLWGILALLTRKSLYKDKNTDLIFAFNEIPYDKKDRDKMLKMVETGDFKDLSSLRETIDGGIKLRIASTPDKKCCCIQVLFLSNIRYEPYTEVKQLDNKQANLLINKNK